MNSPGLFQNEIQKVLDVGVDSSRIIYANPCKQPSHVKYAKEQNVSLMTFDNEAELLKMSVIYPEARYTNHWRSNGNKFINFQNSI